MIVQRIWKKKRTHVSIPKEINRETIKNKLREIVKNEHKNNKVVGFFVADTFWDNINDCPTISIGFSLCNKKDKFNKELGLNIAIARSEHYLNHRCNNFLPDIPLSIREKLIKFIERCKKYYKVDINKFPSWVQEFVRIKELFPNDFKKSKSLSYNWKSY